MMHKNKLILKRYSKNLKATCLQKITFQNKYSQLEKHIVKNNKMAKENFLSIYICNGER